MRVLKCGDHSCIAYKTKGEKWDALKAFIDEGIKEKEKILYIADDKSIVEVQETFGTHESLLCMKSDDTYCKNGSFEPTVMYNLITEMEMKAMTEGYTGLRGCGEMSWMFEDIPGSDKVIEYERNLDNFLQGKKICLLCLYNKNMFGLEMTDLMERIHAKN